jgi:protocatechuate 3,4-dioxygenase beta subunit
MRRLFAIIVVVIGSAAPTGRAQSPLPPRDTSRSVVRDTRAGTARITGRVVSAETGDSIRNARVSIVPAPDNNSATLLADGDGRFEFTGLAAGTYTLSAAKPGLAGSSPSAKNPRERPIPVTVSDAAAVTGVTITLPRGAAITGRVVDDLGEPSANTTVFVERLIETTGVRTARERRTAVTNDIGEYRVGSLPEGTYVVSRFSPTLTQVVRNGANTIVVQTGPGSPRPVPARTQEDDGPPRVYYPDADTLSEAAAITIKAGEERGSVDLVGPSPFPAMTDLALAQDPTPIARDPTARAASAIGGRVLGPGGPLAEAEVRLSGDAIRPIPAVHTGALGQYEFANLPAGTYVVNVRKNRFVGGTAQVALGVDERREQTDITLARTSVIAGQVTDEYGDPVEGVTVRLHRIRFVSGRRRLVESPGAPSSSTDDLGRYRLANLQPGSYIVAAYVGQLVAGLPGAMDIPGYATTYFPGTPNPPESRQIAVGSSQDLDGINFSLSRIPTALLSGAAMASTGEAITGGLTLNSSRRSSGVGTLSMGAYIQPDGSFEFRNVPPGQYVIQAYRGRIRSSAEGEFAALPITVNGSPIRDLTVQTSPGSTISGHLSFDGAALPTSRNIVLTALPADADLAPLDGNFARADIHDDWTFEMSGISGPRRLRLLQAPRGWGLSRILVNGVDVTDVPLPFGARNQSLADVEVVLTDRVSEVTGTVTDDRSRPIPDARVLVFATERDLWYDRSRFVKVTGSATDGRFTMRDLPPGNYYVVAVDRRRASEDNGEWMNPELLDSLTAGATQMTLSDGQKTSINPKFFP